MHFDNFGSSLLCVLAIVVGGWNDVAQDTFAITRMDHQPKPYNENGSVGFLLYYIFGVTLFAYFGTNLFVAVLSEVRYALLTKKVCAPDCRHSFERTDLPSSSIDRFGESITNERREGRSDITGRCASVARDPSMG